MRWWRRLSAWLAGSLAAAVLGSLLQTQLNLAALSRLGASIDWPVRMQASVHDLLGFGPTWWALLLAGFLVALPVAAWLTARRGQRSVWYALGGAMAVVAILCSMRTLLGITVVAAARHWPGFLCLSLAGAVGAWASGRWLSARPRRDISATMGDN
ncbi:MAG: hypothetical protein KDI48_19240 [Xanthomonadales bacterium]|nr:hypothetical protein [Xanthomonadales bacterium]